MVHSTSITCSPVLVHRYSGYRTPPVSRFVIHLTAVRSLPRSTRLWYVCARCSADSSLRATVSYSAHVGRVTLTSIPFLPSSQASRSFSVSRQMVWYAVKCRARCGITVWKTMNRSEFHFLSRTPPSSPPSAPTKRLLTFPLGTSWHLDGITARSRDHACHAVSFPILPSKLLPGLA